jgi:hypothetical protein
MFVTQRGKIVDGQSKANFLEQFANGNVDMLFVI